jgi:hypothetical protein
MSGDKIHLRKGEIFVQLKKQLETDLAQAGFRKGAKPGAEPELPQLSSKPDNTIKDLYDDLLAFQGYLIDRLTSLTVYVKTTKERVKVVKASVLMEAAGDKKRFPNAEMRGAYVDCHPEVLEALRDALYFEQRYDATEQWCRKVGKKVDRTYRELSLRAQNTGFSGRGSYSGGKEVVQDPTKDMGTGPKAKPVRYRRTSRRSS